MTHGPRVLVVDNVSDTEEVLRAVLEPRGVQVERISQREGALPPATARPPALLVIDSEETAAPHQRPTSWEHVPQVILGTARLPPRETAGCDQEYLRKPFHYAELIQAIDRLITAQETSPKN